MSVTTVFFHSQTSIHACQFPSPHTLFHHSPISQNTTKIVDPLFLSPPHPTRRCPDRRTIVVAILYLNMRESPNFISSQPVKPQNQRKQSQIHATTEKLLKSTFKSLKRLKNWISIPNPLLILAFFLKILASNPDIQVQIYPINRGVSSTP